MRYSRARNIPSWLCRSIKMLVVSQMSCYLPDTLWCHVFCIDVSAANSIYLWREIECARVSTHYLLNWCLCFFPFISEKKSWSTSRRPGDPVMSHIARDVTWTFSVVFKTLKVGRAGTSEIVREHLACQGWSDALITKWSAFFYHPHNCDQGCIALLTL